jgi:hypothetical protein
MIGVGMSWWTIIATCVTAIGGPAVVLKILGDRLLERQKAHYSKEMAELAHERSVLLAETQNAFSMGTTSHMATVAFDKHIGFCEEYIEAMSNALNTLIQEGMKEKALGTSDFFRIRQKWALWLTPEMETKLDQFEQEITKIGGDAQVFDIAGAPLSNERSVRRVIADFREVLGTKGLTDLRKDLLVRSSRKPTD